MSTVYTEYVTTGGERWDNIADRFLCTMSEIIDANPDVPITGRLSPNLILKVPVKTSIVNTTDTSKLPPWKQ